MAAGPRNQRTCSSPAKAWWQTMSFESLVGIIPTATLVCAHPSSALVQVGGGQPASQCVSTKKSWCLLRWLMLTAYLMRVLGSDLASNAHGFEVQKLTMDNVTNELSLWLRTSLSLITMNKTIVMCVLHVNKNSNPVADIQVAVGMALQKQDKKLNSTLYAPCRQTVWDPFSQFSIFFAFANQILWNRYICLATVHKTRAVSAAGCPIICLKMIDHALLPTNGKPHTM